MNNTIETEMQRLEKVIDKELGFFWWKRYIAAAFWSNVSTPINLAITLFTALTTAQTTTNNLISQKAYVNLSITTLVLSVLNTFFRPHNQMTDNMKVMAELEKLGDLFETIYYSNSSSEEDKIRRLDAYKSLRTDVDKYITSVSIEGRNFLTDFIHLIVHNTALRGREGWLYPIHNISGENI